MAAEVVSILSLSVFVVSLLGPLLRIRGRVLIPLPLQTTLVLGALLNVLLAALGRWLAGGSLPELLAIPAGVASNVILLPIIALAGGFLLAGAMEASGGFAALRLTVDRLRGTPLGLAGTLVVLVQLATIFALPCGRIMAAALLPLAVSLGPKGARLLSARQTLVLVTALAVNAAASCGPSRIGGVGQIAEGFLQQPGLLSNAQSFGVMLGTAVTALFVSLFHSRFMTEPAVASPTVPTTESPESPPEAPAPPAVLRPPLTGYIALGVFLLAVSGPVFGLFGRTPVTLVIPAAALLIILVSRASLGRVAGSIPLYPITVLAAGFLMTGSLIVAGGFHTLGEALLGLAGLRLFGVGLGAAGMLVIFVNLGTLLPLPCGRVLAAALLPVLVGLGPATGWLPGASGLLSFEQLACLSAAFIVSAAAGCGPSLIGGTAALGEGLTRVEAGSLRPAQRIGILLGMTPMAALTMRFLVLNPSPFTLGNLGLFLGLTTALLLFAWAAPRLLGPGSTDVAPRRLASWIVFTLGGAIAGALLAVALFLPDPGGAFALVTAATFGGAVAQSAVAGALVGALLRLTQEAP